MKEHTVRERESETDRVKEKKGLGAKRINLKGLMSLGKMREKRNVKR